MRIELVNPRELGGAAIGEWRRLQRANTSLRSPYFTPDYAMLVASARPDTRLAMIEDGGAICGFFALQHGASAAGMALGAPLNDYQGVVGSSELELDPRQLCKATGVARFDFTHIPTDQKIFVAHARSSATAWVSDVSCGADAYFAGVRARHRNFLYQLGRVRRKFEREHGAMIFSAHVQNNDHLETLLAWKSEQLAECGQPLVWKRRWVRQAIERSRAEANADFGGVLFTLTRDDTLLAANFCFYSESVLHGLVMAHHRGFEAYSPGIQLLRAMIEWAAERGIAEVDFGAGEGLYKRQFGTHKRTTMSGWVGLPSLSSLLRATQYAARRQVEKIPNAWVASLPGRAMRRLDVYRSLAAPPMPEGPRS